MNQSIDMTNVQPEVTTITRVLMDCLGPNLVSAIGGAQHSSASGQWTEPNVDLPPDTIERLTTAYQAWQILETAGAGSVATHWFIGQNPLLDDIAPFIAIRDGQHDAVLNAVNVFIRHHWHA